MASMSDMSAIKALNLEALTSLISLGKKDKPSIYKGCERAAHACWLINGLHNAAAPRPLSNLRRVSKSCDINDVSF